MTNNVLLQPVFCHVHTLVKVVLRFMLLFVNDRLYGFVSGDMTMGSEPI